MRKAVGAEAELTKGSGGVFEVKVDGKVVFSKKDAGRFPNDGEVAKLLRG